MLATVDEDELRARRELTCRCGYEQLARTSGCGDATGDVERDAARSAVDVLDLACVDPRADRQPGGRRACNHRKRAPDRARGTLEGGDEAVAGSVELLPAEASELCPDPALVSRD